MKVRNFLRHIERESRGERGKLVFFILSLAIGVAAVVSVAGFIEGLDRGVRGQARQLLAADLAIRGQTPVTDEVSEAIDALPARRTAVRELLTVAAVESGSEGGRGRSQLVELKAIAGEYPFYGDLELDPPRSLAELLDEGSTVVAPELLPRLGVAVGDEIRLGGEPFRVSGVVASEPDRIAGAFSLGPRVFLSDAGLERAGLVKFGSRVRHYTLVALPDELGGELEGVAADLQAVLPADGRHRIETYRDAQPQLRRGLRQMERYLGLAALLSLLVGGVGVAQTVRAWLAGRIDAIAVLKCLGYRPHEVLVLYLAQAALLGLLASLLGGALGIGLQAVAARLLEGVLPVEHLVLFQPMALLRGLALGVGVAVIFTLPPLLAARRVPPVRVLRRDAEPLPPSRVATATVGAGLVFGVLALASWQAGSLALGAGFTASLLLVTGVLFAAAGGLVRLAGRPRQATRLWLRQGIAALARPGSGTVGGIVALGIGILVVLAMYLVERRLAAQFDNEVPADAPSAFLLDIQTDQWPGVAAALERQGALDIDSVEVVTARFLEIDGRPIETLVESRGQRTSEAGRRAADRGDERAAEGSEDSGGSWALRREQRLAVIPELPDDNEVIAGELFAKPGVGEVSVEQEYAEALGVAVGSTMRLDVRGVPIDLEVTSIRTVDWSSFGINFYLAAEPEAFLGAPRFRIATARLPPDRESELQNTLALDYPNVTMIRIREVLERVRRILTQLGLGVRLLGGLTVLAGLAILGGAVSATALRRGGEVALLKTLGMTRLQVLAGFATEYALVGLVAGMIGSLGGGLIAWWVVRRGLEVEWLFDPVGQLAAIVAAVALSVGAGLLASFRALSRRPIEALRNTD